MRLYTIGDLEIISGIKAHTIRIWEKRYQLIVPSRSEGNTRYYTDGELVRLMNVALLNKNGVKISHIVKMGENERAEKALELSKAKVDGDSLLHAALVFDKDRINEYFNQIIADFGIEGAFLDLIFPFLNKIGLLWTVNRINPGQEHFFSNLCRQKLFVAIDRLSVKKEKQTAVLFLPEWDLHEIGLLLYNYMLLKNGYDTIYLGQLVNLNDLENTIKVTGASIALGTFIAPAEEANISQFVETMTEESPETHFYLSGPQLNEDLNYENLTTFTSMSELKKILHLL